MLVVNALKDSLDMLAMLLFFISVAIVLFSTFMYYAERGTYRTELGYWARDTDVSRGRAGPWLHPCGCQT